MIIIKASHDSKPEVPDSGDGGGWTQRVKGWFSSVRALYLASNKYFQFTCLLT